MKLIINNAEFDTKDLTPEQREQLKAELDKPESKGRWVPENEDLYYFVEDSSDATPTHWCGNYEDQFRLSQGNVFKTAEEAGKHLQYLEAVAVIREDAEWFEPDWSDEMQDKYHGWYSPEEGKFCIAYTGIRPGTIYFETKEAILKSMKVHRKEWLIYCGVNDG